MKTCANPRCARTIDEGQGKVFYQPKQRLFSPRTGVVSKVFWLCDLCQARVEKLSLKRPIKLKVA